MRKLVFAAIGAVALSVVALSNPAEARCWWNGWSWHCWHHPYRWHSWHYWDRYPYTRYGYRYDPYYPWY